MHLKKKNLRSLHNNTARVVGGFCCAVLMTMQAAFAQDTGDGFVVDEIIAKVDNYIVLKSEVDRMYQD